MSTTHDITVKESSFSRRWIWDCTCGATAASWATSQEAQDHATTHHIQPILNPAGYEPIPDGTAVLVTGGKFEGTRATSCGYRTGPMMCIHAPHVQGGPHLHVQRSHIEVL
jgi:hypothetical protein